MPSHKKKLKSSQASIAELKASLPRIKLEAVEKPSITLCRIRDMFRQSTGLDVFLSIRRDSSDSWSMLPLGDDAELPAFCQLLHQDKKRRKTCTICHGEMTKKSVNAQRPQCQYCHSGLLTMHYPVWVDGVGMGDLQTVCALPKSKLDRLTEQLQKRISKFELSSTVADQAIESLEILSKQDEHNVKEWLELIVDYLSESSMTIFGNSDENVSDGSSSTIVRSPEVPDLEHRIRLEIGRAVALPAWRGQRSTGFSDVLTLQIKKFLLKHYKENISLQVISDALGFECSYFAKMYKLFGEESLVHTLRNIRIKQAKKLLLNPHLSIQEIASEVGFHDASYFGSVFRSLVRSTPSEYREEIL